MQEKYEITPCCGGGGGGTLMGHHVFCNMLYFCLASKRNLGIITKGKGSYLSVLSFGIVE